MSVLEFPAGAVAKAANNWRLKPMTNSPGRGMDGRQQFLVRENRTWAVEYHAREAWDTYRGQYLAFIDQVAGVRTSFLVPVDNSLTTTYNGDPTAFYTGLGFTAQEISDGFQKWSDGTVFGDSTGWALPSYADPVVAIAAPVGASRVFLDNYLGRAIAVGAFFEVNNFLYRVQSNDDGDIRFNPPLREALPLGTTVEVNAPKARVRFADDAAYDAAMDIQQYGAPYTLSFVEAFDR